MLTVRVYLCCFATTVDKPSNSSWRLISLSIWRSFNVSIRCCTTSSSFSTFLYGRHFFFRDFHPSTFFFGIFICRHFFLSVFFFRHFFFRSFLYHSYYSCYWTNHKTLTNVCRHVHFLKLSASCEVFLSERLCNIIHL